MLKFQLRILSVLFLLFPVFAEALSDDVNIRQRSIALPGAQMTVYFESPFSVADEQKLVHWLKVSAEAVSLLYGEFPVKQVDVHLHDRPRANEPVPWGEVWKEGGYKVNFLVNPNFPLSAFVADWTASHELSHLLHPYPGSGNSWFGEGMASYYQNILRVRQQSLGEEQAWQKLFEGFQRGERQANRSGMTLQEASNNMRLMGGYMHVYWGGAAYFLNVDMRLRLVSKGRKSLDSAWFEFKRCCLFHDRHWPVKKLIRKLDQLTGTTVFGDEYRRMIHRRAFPDYRSSLRQLGVTIKGSRVQLSNQASPATTLRSWIVTASSLQ